MLCLELDGTYSNLLRYVQNIHWSTHVTFEEIYETLPPVFLRRTQRQVLSSQGTAFKPRGKLPTPTFNAASKIPTSPLMQPEKRSMATYHLSLLELHRGECSLQDTAFELRGSCITPSPLESRLPCSEIQKTYLL